MRPVIPVSLSILLAILVCSCGEEEPALLTKNGSVTVIKAGTSS